MNAFKMRKFEDGCLESGQKLGYLTSSFSQLCIPKRWNKILTHWWWICRFFMQQRTSTTDSKPALPAALKYTSRGEACWQHRLQVCKLILDCRTITTRSWTSPWKDRSVWQDGCKCIPCGLHMLHTPEIPKLILDCGAISTRTSAPGHDPVAPRPGVWRDCIGSARTCPSAVTSLRKPCSKDFWAKRFKFPTLEDSAMERLFRFPLGKAT